MSRKIGIFLIFLWRKPYPRFARRKEGVDKCASTVQIQQELPNCLLPGYPFALALHVPPAMAANTSVCPWSAGLSRLKVAPTGEMVIHGIGQRNDLGNRLLRHVAEVGYKIETDGYE